MENIVTDFGKDAPEEIRKECVFIAPGFTFTPADGIKGVYMGHDSHGYYYKLVPDEPR